LSSADAAYRAVAARYAAKDATATLRTLLAADPAPTVRATAVARLVAIEGDAALPTLLQALYDPDPVVRNTAARAAGSRGAPGVGALRGAVFDHAEPAAAGPLARSMAVPLKEQLAPLKEQLAAPRERATKLEAQQAALVGLGAAGRTGRTVLIEVAREAPDETLKQLARMALGFAPDSH
jgi:HEAT repeat protein